MGASRARRGSRLGRVTIALALLGGSWFAAAATAATGTISASGGRVGASVTYEVSRSFDTYVDASQITLSVSPADGRSAQVFTTAELGFEYPDNLLDLPRALRVRDLDGDGDPEVVLDTYWNGAHCCFETRVASWSPKAGTYVLTTMLWGNSQPALRDLNGDGRPEFVGWDDRFAYALGTSYAGSTFARRVWAWRGGRFVDVTRRYPILAARAMRSAWAEYVRRRRSDSRELASPLAAYLADAYSAGGANPRVAWRRVVAAEGARNPRMLRGIRNQLRRWGYIR